MATQPQQQQQSLSEEGSKENTILSGPRHQKEGVLRIILQAQQTACHKDQPLQHLHHKLEDHHRLPQSTIRTEITRIHWNAMEPPMDPPEHLQIVKAQELLKVGTRLRNLVLELHQIQVLLHSLLNHPETLLYVQHVAKVATGAETALITIFVTFVGLPPTLHICAELLSVEPDHQSVYTVVKLTIGQLIVGTDLDTTEKSLEIHQMHYKLVTLVKTQHWQPEIKVDPPLALIIRFLSPIQMVKVKINPMEVNTDISRESKPVLLPEVTSQMLILIFPLEDSNTLTLMKVSTGDILPPHFLPLDLITQWPVMLLVDPLSN